MPSNVLGWNTPEWLLPLVRLRMGPPPGQGDREEKMYLAHKLGGKAHEQSPAFPSGVLSLTHPLLAT